MPQTAAVGLTADWLNGWLAAIGAAVLVPDLRVAWTREAVPKAVLHLDGPAPEAIASTLPTLADLAGLAIARSHAESAVELPRKVTREAYRARASIARRRHDPTLGASLTDMVEAGEGEAAHSPLDPPAPRGETLHDRVVRCRAALGTGDQLIEAVRASLAGRATRIKANGLGFDSRRLAAAVGPQDIWVDPVVEILAFHALPLLPIRGDGKRAHIRGWTAAPSRRGAFTWPVWDPPLDSWAVDALLDRWYRDGQRAAGYGITAAYLSVAYQPKATSDVTRAYAAERLPSW
jgi:hypothetical protein